MTDATLRPSDEVVDAALRLLDDVPALPPRHTPTVAVDLGWNLLYMAATVLALEVKALRADVHELRAARSS